MQSNVGSDHHRIPYHESFLQLYRNCWKHLRHREKTTDARGSTEFQLVIADKSLVSRNQDTNFGVQTKLYKNFNLSDHSVILTQRNMNLEQLLVYSVRRFREKIAQFETILGSQEYRKT